MDQRTAGASVGREPKVTKNRKLIVNLTRGTALCEGVLADRPLSRMRGLLGRDSLPAGEGMLLRPAPSIHTAFMRFPIDALFLDSNLTVLGIEAEMRPWRVASRRRARAVLELAAGESGRLGVRIGDRLSVRERDGVDGLDVAAVSGSSAAVLDAETPAVTDALVASMPDRDARTVWAPELDARPHGAVARMRPLSVLVISADRRFRSVASVLVARRGCAVATAESADRLGELTARVRADVIVVDRDATGESADAVARARALPGVGLVVVEEEPAPHGHGELQALAKWGPFERLFAAIEAADKGRAPQGGVDGRS
jgi:uncharacterized membrane protein (UPF0127 family)